MILKGRDIARFLATPGGWARAALIHGRDLGVVRERARDLAAVVTERPEDPFDVALLGEGDLAEDPARLESELAAFSMMGGRRMVRLRLSGERAALERDVAEALAGHGAGRFNPAAFLLIEAASLGRESHLLKAAEKASYCAAIACYADEAVDLARFTREALAADKLSLTSEALELFVSRLPHERGVARREIERLALFMGPGGGRAVGAADLEDFLGVEPEASLAEAADDAFGGRARAAHQGLRRAALEGERGPAGVRAMGIHLGRLRRAVTLAKAGAAPAQAAKSAGVFWKNEREFLRQARAWTLADIDAAQADILTADRACKQTGAPDDLLCERLALTVAGRARRLGL